MSTLYVSDLDGTLLDADRKVSSSSESLLNEAISKGALFSVATARTPATVSRLLSGVDCRLPLIVMTGAAIWDSRNNTYLHAAFHSEDAARMLLETYRRHGLSSFIYTLGEDNLLHIYHIGSLSALEKQFIAERVDSPFKAFHIPAYGESQLPAHLDRVLLFFCMRPTAEVAPVYDEIKNNASVRPVYYHDMYGDEIALMEVFCPEASKATAVKLLAGMSGADSVVAYGDNVNDLPILEIADDSVAVANAVEEVKTHADRMIGANTSDAVARDILKLVKGEK